MACYDGFGNLADGKHPIWIGDFSGNGRADVLFFYYDDKNWWLGSYQTGQITWSFAGNTAGFGNSPEGCPMWIGNFSRADRAEVLFYYPGDGNWWLGTHDGSRLNWTFAGNTSGYQPPAPPMAPECEAIANRIESLNAEIDDLQAELQNAAPGQKAGLASAIKALQQRISTQQRALNDCFLRHPRPSLPAYPNFGNLADGRPFWQLLTR